MSRATQSSSRGFTLLEIGIVLGVIAILIAAVAPRLQGEREAALRKRLATELVNLGDATLAYWARRVELLGTGCADGVCDEVEKRWLDGGVNLVGRTETLNLAVAGSRGLFGDILPQNFNGQNPFGGAYEVLLNSRRVTVRTCAPDGDVGQVTSLLRTGAACGNACAAPRPLAICYSQAVLPGRIPSVGFEKRYLHYGQAGTTYDVLP